MKRNKSQELVHAHGNVSETDHSNVTPINPIESLVDQADQAVRSGNLQESREHLTRVFELLASSPYNRMSIPAEVPYKGELLAMRQSA